MATRSAKIDQKADLIWAIADKLTGVYKPHEYGDVILPLTVIRRFDCILSDTKDAVLQKYDEVKNLPMKDILLRKASKKDFYNTSKYTFERLMDDPDHIEENFREYLNKFSANVRDILEKFKFDGHITTMANKGILYIVLKEYTTDRGNLHPNEISNLEMGYIFEEIIRRFSESHNEDAGQHYTPREVIQLMVNILFYDDNDILSGNNVAKTIYDPACGTGGMLSVAEEYLHSLNASTELVSFGQEINDQTFAICKADMLIKGNNADYIKDGNTLSDDQFAGSTFDYILSNPPFGREWKNEKAKVEEEAKLGFGGRFGAGLPAASDGQMLFLMTAISKMKDIDKGGSRIAIIHNGSPLFTGDAGSGPSEIRRHILENDLLEAIIALLCKDSLMEILQKYMHLQQEYDKNGNLVKETMIFPRYHQLDVVTKLLEDVKKNGSGKSYLIQHSAGSGKSNSIAWLAHRLTGLHDYEDNKIFQSVIIVTDRRVLDSQLQSTVYQFDHVEGVVKKVDKNSGQLRDAINDGVGIIITTLQKFPVIYKEVDSAKKRFAIIIDEAHSSQTGDAAKKLKRALADTEVILKEYAEMEDEDERNRKDDEDKLLDELAAQGMHKNLSFFAFTATPKGKTLQLFGQKDAEGIYRPFHIYSMRQAIEEHFILDVLQNYMTYKMYYKIAKIIEDNPEFDTTAGSKAIINYETLHPHNISQKTAIMLEHFMNVTRHKIGGRAKAMVVTPSRLHAVRYVQEFKRQIKEKGLNDLEVLVAFSGEVKDNDDVFTEEGMNKDKEGKTIKEKALPETFHADDYGILVVAEKYQTGFDEPLLHTMFVDKKLSGVKAVQTLSRLNRTTRGKVDTFVLDFVNSAEDIKASFEPFYEETVLLEETDPNVVYDMKNTLDDFRVYQKSEVDKFADIFYQNENQSAGDLGKLQGQLRPAIDRYEVLEVEKQDIFKSTLASFNRVYAYITQVCRLFDKDIHRFSIYSKFLYTMLPV